MKSREELERLFIENLIEVMDDSESLFMSDNDDIILELLGNNTYIFKKYKWNMRKARK